MLEDARRGLLDPTRRGTNGLIAVNAALFAAQVASNGAVTQWGVKVDLCCTYLVVFYRCVPAARLCCLRILFRVLPILAFASPSIYTDSDDCALLAVCSCH